MFHPGLKLNNINYFPSYDESWCTGLLGKIRWKDCCCVMCSRCQSFSIKKEDGWSLSTVISKILLQAVWNRIQGQDRYCISLLTYTILRIWFLALYLYFVLWPGCSIREIPSEVVVIPFPRCSGFIRTAMERVVIIIVIVIYQTRWSCCRMWWILYQSRLER